jgi:hypothetical protein
MDEIEGLITSLKWVDDTSVGNQLAMKINERMNSAAAKAKLFNSRELML